MWELGDTYEDPGEKEDQSHKEPAVSSYDIFGSENKYSERSERHPLHIVYQLEDEGEEDTAEVEQQQKHQEMKDREKEEQGAQKSMQKHAIYWKRVVDEQMRIKEEEMWELSDT